MLNIIISMWKLGLLKAEARVRAALYFFSPCTHVFLGVYREFTQGQYGGFCRSWQGCHCTKSCLRVGCASDELRWSETT